MIQFNSLPVIPLRITSKYGDRTEEVKYIKGATKWHNGVDLGRNKAVSGDCKILAVMDGIVSASYWNNYRGWVLIINHGNGVETLYQHMRDRGVSVGTKISSGKQIGVMGQTGSGAGLHLHFELRIYGKPVDPTNYLNNVKPKEDEELITKVKMNINGVIKEVDSIVKDNKNYVELRDLSDVIDVSYDVGKKMPVIKTK